MTTDVLQYFHPLMRSAQLRAKPARLTIAGHPIVLFRDAAGKPAALDELCPHRHAPLSMGRVNRDGRLVCPYHGWHFDADGHGASPSSPHLRHCDTTAYQVVERHQHLWLAERDTPLAAFPALDADDFVYAGSVAARVRAPLDVTLDNISEDEHFPFIHTTFGWSEQALGEVRLATLTAPGQCEVHYTGVQRRSPWALLGGVRAGDRFHNHWVTRFDPVHALYTFGWTDARSGQARPVVTRAAVFLVPETAARTRICMLLFLHLGSRGRRALRPAMAWLARHIARMELRRDVRLIESVAEAPRALSSMRLTQFDRALIHNRKLLQTIYWGSGAQRVVPIHPREELP